jgi:hypothetical protein
MGRSAEATSARSRPRVSGDDSAWSARSRSCHNPGEQGARAGPDGLRHGQVPALCGRLSLDGLSPDDRDRAAVGPAQQVADVRDGRRNCPDLFFCCWWCPVAAADGPGRVAGPGRPARGRSRAGRKEASLPNAVTGGRARAASSGESPSPAPVGAWSDAGGHRPSHSIHWPDGWARASRRLWSPAWSKVRAPSTAKTPSRW